MSRTWEEHQTLIAQLEQQQAEKEASEARKCQEAAEMPLREQALQAAQEPVDLSRYRNERNLAIFAHPLERDNITYF